MHNISSIFLGYHCLCACRKSSPPIIQIAFKYTVLVHNGDTSDAPNSGSRYICYSLRSVIQVARYCFWILCSCSVLHLCTIYILWYCHFSVNIIMLQTSQSYVTCPSSSIDKVKVYVVLWCLVHNLLFKPFLIISLKIVILVEILYTMIGWWYLL